MTKEKYMALADFQTLWTDRIKPRIPEIAGNSAPASDQTCEDIITELT